MLNKQNYLYNDSGILWEHYYHPVYDNGGDSSVNIENETQQVTGAQQVTEKQIIEKEVKTYPYKILIIGLFFAVTTFMAALAWNNVIVDTITLISERTGLESIAPSITYGRVILGWIYTLILTGLLLILLYVFRTSVPPEFLLV